MKKFVNFRFVVTLVLAVFANVATYAQDNVVDEVVWAKSLTRKKVIPWPHTYGGIVNNWI